MSEIRDKVEVEKPRERFHPVSETSGKLRRVYVNLRPTDSSLLESELAIVKAVSDESPDVDFVLVESVLQRKLGVFFWKKQVLRRNGLGRN